MAGKKRRRRWLRALGWLLLLVAVLTAAPLLLWRFVPPPFSTLMMVDRLTAGSELPAYGLRYDWMPMEQISPHLALAVVAAEDQKFPHHAGFDIESIRSAWANYQEGGRLRGASTISQQTAKNLMLWNGRSWVRKGLEAWYTGWMELTWPKRRILEIYINIAEFGPYIYGAEAASQHYFNRPAAELTREQAALLAAVLPSPWRYRVDAPSDYVRKRQAWILRQMGQLGGVAYVQGL